jgi:hypothetical protein
MTYHEIILWSLRASNEDGYTLSHYYQPSMKRAMKTIDANKQAESNYHNPNETSVKEAIHNDKSVTPKRFDSK